MLLFHMTMQMKKIKPNRKIDIITIKVFIKTDFN